MTLWTRHGVGPCTVCPNSSRQFAFVGPLHVMSSGCVLQVLGCVNSWLLPQARLLSGCVTSLGGISRVSVFHAAVVMNITLHASGWGVAASTPSFVRTPVGDAGFEWNVRGKIPSATKHPESEALVLSEERATTLCAFVSRSQPLKIETGERIAFCGFRKRSSIPELRRNFQFV